MLRLQSHFCLWASCAATSHPCECTNASSQVDTRVCGVYRGNITGWNAATGAMDFQFTAVDILLFDKQVRRGTTLSATRSNWSSTCKVLPMAPSSVQTGWAALTAVAPNLSWSLMELSHHRCTSRFHNQNEGILRHTILMKSNKHQLSSLLDVLGVLKADDFPC